jgi:hypothetical protein
MEAVCSTETSVDFQRTTRRYIPEDRTLNIIIVLRTAFNEIWSGEMSTVEVNGIVIYKLSRLWCLSLWNRFNFKL